MDDRTIQQGPSEGKGVKKEKKDYRKKFLGV